jgi:hypothetical protein
MMYFQRLFRLTISGYLVSLGLQACQANLTSASVPQTENRSLLSSKTLNTTIENYVDKYLSEIIRIRNFNRERVSKVFCVHRTFYVETATTEPNAVNAYIKLVCVEGTPSISKVSSLTNPTGLVSKLSLQKYPNQDRFKVITDDTPRDTPFYAEDLRRILSNELMARMNAIKPDTKADESTIRRKAEEYYKSQKAKC